jgi:hypothetical protein
MVIELKFAAYNADVTDCAARGLVRLKPKRPCGGTLGANVDSLRQNRAALLPGSEAGNS